MKKLIVALTALTVTIAAYGQGQFVFNTRSLPDINARFALPTDPAGTSTVAGDAFNVQLLAGPVGGTLQPLTPLIPFRTGNAAGYTAPATFTVPGIAGGQNAQIQVRAFQGTDFAAAALKVESGLFTVQLQEAPNTPNNVPLGTTGFTLVPEPSTLALGLLGLGALLAIRRRK